MIVKCLYHIVFVFVMLQCSFAGRRIGEIVIIVDQPFQSGIGKIEDAREFLHQISFQINVLVENTLLRFLIGSEVVETLFKGNDQQPALEPVAVILGLDHIICKENELAVDLCGIGLFKFFFDFNGIPAGQCL